MSYDPAIDPALDLLDFMSEAVGRNGWCRHDQNWRFGWGRVALRGDPVSRGLYRATALARRVLTTLKCLVCIALNREAECASWEVADWPTVALYNFSSWTSYQWLGPCYDFDVLAVARGWRNWRFAFYSTGAP